MKYLIITLLLFTQVAHAENWLNDSKILASSKEAHSLKSDCERISNEKCYELGSYPSSVYSRALIEVDDLNKPIYENEVLIGYEKKSENTITLDSQKLQDYQAQEVIKAQLGQKEAGLQTALRKIDCGKRVIALMVIRNVPKALSPAQIAQMNTVYAPIKGLLETASLVTAKEFILATTADGTLITEADKTDLANETQKCIDLQ